MSKTEDTDLCSQYPTLKICQHGGIARLMLKIRDQETSDEDFVYYSDRLMRF